MVVHQCLWPLFDGLLKKGLFTNVAHLQALEQNSFDWTVVSLWAAKITHLPRRVKTTNLAAESASDGGFLGCSNVFQRWEQKSVDPWCWGFAVNLKQLPNLLPIPSVFGPLPKSLLQLWSLAPWSHITNSKKFFAKKLMVASHQNPQPHIHMIFPLQIMVQHASCYLKKL